VRRNWKLEIIELFFAENGNPRDNDTLIL